MADGSVTKNALIYGGASPVGATCIHQFKLQANWWIVSVDLQASHHADVNIILAKDDPVEAQEADVLKAVGTVLQGKTFDLVFCATESFMSGCVADNLVERSVTMWRSHVWSALISTSIAANHLKRGGVFIFLGAGIALSGTPDCIGYGMSKAAVHQLIKSLAEKNGGLPSEVTVVGVLPTSLDTSDRLNVGDVGTRTPLQFVSDLVAKWATGSDLPKSGTLCQLVTSNFRTEIVFIK